MGVTEGDPPTALTPYFTVTDADAFLGFLEQVFAARVVRMNRHPDGSVQHARVRIGDGLIMVNQAVGGVRPSRQQMHLRVPDVKQVHAAALAEGATEIMPYNLRPHGEHMTGFVDPFDNTWWVASPA